MTMHRMPPKIDAIKLALLSLSFAAEPESVLSVVFVSLISCIVSIVVFVVGADVGSIMRDNDSFVRDIDGNKLGAIDGIFDGAVVCDVMGDINGKVTGAPVGSRAVSLLQVVLNVVDIAIGS